MYFFLQGCPKKNTHLLLMSSQPKYYTNGHAFLRYIMNMESISVKKLDLPFFCSELVEHQSCSTFLWNYMRTLNLQYPTFLCPYIFGRQSWTNNDQTFVKPILEMGDIDESVLTDIISLNAKCSKWTAWVLVVMISDEMTISGRSQPSPWKIKYLF